MIMIELKRFFFARFSLLRFFCHFQLKLTNVANEVVKDRRNKYNPHI